MCIFGVPLVHVLPTEERTLNYVLLSALIIFCTTMCLCILFIPKVILFSSHVTTISYYGVHFKLECIWVVISIKFNLNNLKASNDNTTDQALQYAASDVSMHYLTISYEKIY